MSFDNQKQYLETETDSTIRGTAVLWEDTSDTLRAISAVNPLPVNNQPSTSTGWDTANFTSGDGSTALTNSAQVVKASAGTLGGYYYGNPNSVACWILFYNVAAASVTVGTTNPKCVYWIPAGAAANIEISKGIPFSNNGWSIAAVMTTAGGTTAPTTPLEVMVYFK